MSDWRFLVLEIEASNSVSPYAKYSSVCVIFLIIYVSLYSVYASYFLFHYLLGQFSNFEITTENEHKVHLRTKRELRLCEKRFTWFEFCLRSEQNIVRSWRYFAYNKMRFEPVSHYDDLLIFLSIVYIQTICTIFNLSVRVEVSYLCWDLSFALLHTRFVLTYHLIRVNWC